MTIWQYQGEKQYDSFMCQLGQATEPNYSNTNLDVVVTVSCRGGSHLSSVDFKDDHSLYMHELPQSAERL